jgi:hypothetical protein
MQLKRGGYLAFIDHGKSAGYRSKGTLIVISNLSRWNAML